MQMKIGGPAVRIDGQMIDAQNNMATVIETGHTVHGQTVEVLFDGNPTFPVFPRNHGTYVLEIWASGNPAFILLFTCANPPFIEEHGNGALWRFKGV